jgi:hypothetical protein
VASWDDVRRIALALPETSERLSRDLSQWRVKDKLFVWDFTTPHFDGYPAVLVRLACRELLRQSGRFLALRGLQERFVALHLALGACLFL